MFPGSLSRSPGGDVVIEEIGTSEMGQLVEEHVGSQLVSWVASALVSVCCNQNALQQTPSQQPVRTYHHNEASHYEFPANARRWYSEQFPPNLYIL